MADVAFFRRGSRATFHVHKELSKCPEFQAWYSPWERRLRADPLARFFLEKRNFLLKEGPLGIRHNVTNAESLAAAEDVSVAIVRGNLWYRRSPRILVQDGLRTFREWRARRRRTVKQDESRRRVRVHGMRVKIVRGFVDCRPGESAVSVLSEYLDLLEELVDDAEATVASGSIDRRTSMRRDNRNVHSSGAHVRGQHPEVDIARGRCNQYPRYTKALRLWALAGVIEPS